MAFDNMTMKEVWDVLGKKFKDNPEPLAGSDVTYAFELSGDEDIHYGFKIVDGQAKMLYEAPESYDCKLSMSVKNFKKLLVGNLNAATAFMTGRLKVDGKMGYALKLESIIKKYDF